MSAIPPPLDDFLAAALALARRKGFPHLLYIGDLPLPADVLTPAIRKKLTQAVTSEPQRAVVSANGLFAVTIPAYEGLSRQEKLKLALLAGVSAGRFDEGDGVLVIVGKRATSYPDTMMVVFIGGGRQNESSANEDLHFDVPSDERIPAQVMSSLIDQAVTIGIEGWEGHAIGTLFVVGDSARVLERSKQLSLNPFQGYPESEKNLLNPMVRDALRSFAVLDGAFVIREDGVVLAGGRYLQFEESDVKIALGLGARHMAAAGVTRSTTALAICVSQTSGVVRVFRRGEVVLQISPRSRRV
jgi:diadenylate cyclase